MPEPLISVVMPVFNGAEFVDEAVRSIRAQTFRNLELICVDDGSTDTTLEKLRVHAAADPRVRVIEQNHGGVIAALHRGFAEARGRLIARMDSDDVSVPSRLERQLDFLAANPSVILVGGCVEVTDAAGRVLARVSVPTQPAEIRERLRRGNCMVHPTVLFRREVLEIGGFRQAYLDAEDYDMWLRLSERADLANLDVVVLRYRRHRNSVSHLHPVQQALSALCARRAAQLRSEGKEDPSERFPRITEEAGLAFGLTREEMRRTAFRAVVFAHENAVEHGILDAAESFRAAAAPYGTSEAIRQACIDIYARSVYHRVGLKDRLRRFRSILIYRPLLAPDVAYCLLRRKWNALAPQWRRRIWKRLL